MDVLGFAYNEFDEQQRLGVVAAHPRGNHFKKNIIDAFYHGMEHRPDKVEMEFRASLSGECDLWVVSGDGA